MSPPTIHIANDFTQFPGGRYRKHGPGSGEQFRDEFLVPALQKGKVEIEFSGAYGYPASFLEEAFGGLLRNGWMLDQLRHRLLLKADDAAFQVYVDQAWSYMVEQDRRGRPVGAAK